MQLTKKLLGYLNSVFDKDARSFLAFRLRHVSDAFHWQVSERVLRGYDGGFELFVVQLDGHTIRTLVEHLASMDGITVIGTATSDQLSLSAAALIDAEGRQSASNGDWVQAYTSIVWAYYEALSVELVEAKRQIGEALRQMSVKTAEADWLDEWGGYFGFPRDEGESDAKYAERIIAEVLRPRGNNKAIEIGLRDKFGQESRVIDLQRFGDAVPAYNGLIIHDATYNHDASALPYYGLFKVAIGYDLLGGADISDYLQQVRAYIERLRDAGTHLESVELGGSLISDAFEYAPTDGSNFQAVSAFASLDDELPAPGELASVIHIILWSQPEEQAAWNEEAVEWLGEVVSLGSGSEFFAAPGDDAEAHISYEMTYSGLRIHNGAVPYASGSMESVLLS